MSAADIAQLPKGHKSNLASSLNSLQSTVYDGSLLDSFGQKVGIYLKKSALTQNNYKSKVAVEVYSRAKNKAKLTKSSILDLQTLAVMPLILPQIDVRATCETAQECEVLEYIVKIATDKRFLNNPKDYVEVYYKLQHLPNTFEVVQTPLDNKTGVKLTKKSFLGAIIKNSSEPELP